VINSSVTNALGDATGYILVPGENAVPYALPGSSIRQRAGFINHHVWATQYQPDEQAAAGPYPNQSKGGDGLVRFAADNAPLVDQDLVLWYTLGVTHIARPEEWPVMPTAHAGFKLMPGGFFSKNPGLDVAK
jgi:primary-amine oxidase